MNRRRFLLASWPVPSPRRFAAEAQPAGHVNRIGFLRVGPPPAAWIEGFRQGLRELSYVEGRNIMLEFGLAQSAAQLPEMAAKLVRSKVDVIVASGTPSVLPAKNANEDDPDRVRWPPSTLLRPG